ncbi:MAG: AraC family transcriptional regulator [Prosthecobacter sp.]|nr:AraC family transcriptional regulator [Prosthecobacter sp.]
MINSAMASSAFCDQSAFTQQFRKRTGMTPKEFRRRHQGYTQP